MQNEYIVHYGTKGQKWYIRRYQNEDGTLTEAGKKRYGKNTIQKNMPDSLLRAYAANKVEKYGVIKAIEKEQKVFKKSKNLRTATTSAIALGTAVAAMSVNIPLA